MSKRADIPLEVSDRLYETASEKFLQLRAAEGQGRAEIREEIEAWLKADPAHAKAYGQVESAWGAVGENAAVPEMVIARRDALERAGSAARGRWGVVSNFKQYAAVAAVLVIIVSTALFSVFNGEVPSNALIYETAVGETRVLTLADNSRISLDAGTRLEVSYSPEVRAIELYSGQAYFDVAKDPARPFKVKAGDQTVVALGTAFNVEMLKDQVLVTLIEGRVSVIDDRALIMPKEGSSELAPLVQELTPGQQLVISKEKPPELKITVNLEKTSAWRRGKLIFEDDPLSAAVERMNRYSHIKIIIGDEDIQTLGVSGVFNAGDTEAFVEALEVYFALEVTRGSDKSIRLYASH